jgi:hypothetical protein
MRDLGLGSTGTSARALDVNASGQVAGYLGLQAFRWSSSGGLDLLGTPPGWANSFAFAINASGQVAGSASNGSGNAEVVTRYTDGRGWKILGGTGERNVGNGINQWGDVVGTGLLSILRQGVIYTDNLGLLAKIDDLLLTLGSWRIMEAYDINDAQQITGWAINTQTGLRSAVLLTPVNPPPLNQPPVAKFAYSCTASLFCSFDGSGSTDDRGILAWVWTVAGQKITDLQSKFFGIQFSTAQTINLTLTVTDTRGITNSVTQPVAIGGTNQPPVARFTVSCTRKTCVLDASSSTDDHGIVTYRWKPSVSYRATLTGVIITRNRIGTGSNTYQETLTVTDAAGLKNSLTKTINFRQ